MRLANKALSAIVVIWCLIWAVTYFGALQILKKSYTQLENQQVAENFSLLDEAINGLALYTYKTVSGWANWDELYQFAVETDPIKKDSFIKNNYATSTLATSSLDLSLIFGPKGNLVYKTMLSVDRTKEVPFPEDIDLLFQPKNKLRRMVDPPANLYGLVLTSKGIAIIGSREILPTNRIGANDGTLIVGAILNDDLINKVKADSHLDLMIYPLSKVWSDTDLNREYQVLLHKANDFVILNDNTLFLYSLIRDIDSEPIALVKVTTQRDIYLAGVRTIRYFNAIFISAGIIFSLLLFYLLRISLINRLNNINRWVTEIGKTRDFSLRIPTKGSDEISFVGNEINKMLFTIQEVESLLAGTINFMPSMMIIVDENFNITNLNGSAEKETGLSNLQAVGKPLFTLFPYLEEYGNKLNESMQNDSHQEIDRIMYAKDQKTFYFHVIIYPLKSNGEKKLALRLDNISEHIEKEKKLMQYDRLSAVGVLAAGVAHEINNPINFVFASADPLKRNLDSIANVLKKYAETRSSKDTSDFSEKVSDIEETKKTMGFSNTVPETKKLLEVMKEGVRRTAIIMNSLKKFSRANEQAMKKINIYEEVDSALILLQPKFQGRINIIKEYEKTPLVDCFPEKMGQVFLNIIVNAIDAIPDKGEIKIKIWCENNIVRICIRDNGMGISEKNIGKIFDFFFTTKDIGQGTGLGLSIASSIIRDHGGTIEVRSKVGEGAEFTVFLPASYS